MDYTTRVGTRRARTPSCVAAHALTPARGHWRGAPRRPDAGSAPDEEMTMTTMTAQQTAAPTPCRDQYLAAEEPECPLGEHEWSDSHDLVGGCESNPGVHGVGAGITSDSVCTLCGLGRTHYTCTQGSGAETEHDHDGVRYEDDAVYAAGLARHHAGAAPQAALDTYDGAGEDLVDACLAYRLEHGESLSDLVEDADLPAAAVATAIRRAGKAAIEIDDDGPESLDDSDTLWVTSDHALVVDGEQVATWTRCASGSWGSGGARADEWVVEEDTAGGDRLPERIEAILDALRLTDEIPDVPEPESAEDTMTADPAGEYCVYWDTVCEDAHVVARYSAEEDAQAVTRAKERALRGSNPGDLLCGYSVRHLVDGEWLPVAEEE